MSRNEIETVKNNLKAVLGLYNLDSLIHDYKERVEVQGEYTKVVYLGLYEEVLHEMMQLLPDFEYEELRRNLDNDFLRVNITKKSSNASTPSSPESVNP